MHTPEPAVLCLHGLTSSPYEFGPLLSALRARGYRVEAPHLVGHGTRPEALAHTRFPDWLAGARRGFEALAEEHARIFLVGLSMGALCAIALAHERGARVAGLVAMATPLTLNLTDQWALQVAEHLPLAAIKPWILKKSGPDVSDAAVAAAMPSYDRIPLASAASMVAGQRHAHDVLTRLSCPVLLMHGRHDHVAPVRNLDLAWDRLRTPHRARVTYPRSWHILPLDVEHEAVVADVLAFVADPVGYCHRGGPMADRCAPVAPTPPAPLVPEAPR